jgi:hypothetical protein
MSDFKIISDETPKHTKKRKVPEQEDLTEIKAIAKSFCTCPEQWKSVSRYSKEKLKDFVETKNFEKDAAMRDTVFSALHKVYAFTLDFLTKGDGYVKTQIENDISLKDAIEVECGSFLKFLNNKSKIAFLTSTDTVQGKLTQKQNEIAVIELDANVDNETPDQSLELAAVAVDPFDSAEGEEERAEEEKQAQGLDC